MKRGVVLNCIHLMDRYREILQLYRFRYTNQNFKKYYEIFVISPMIKASMY